MWSKTLIFYYKYFGISESKSSLRKFTFAKRNVVLKSFLKWPIQIRGTFWNHLSKRFEGCIDIEDGRQKLTRNWTVQISSHLKIRCICRHVILNFFGKLSQGTPVFISSSMKSTITITSSTACHCMMRMIACIK